MRKLRPPIEQWGPVDGRMLYMAFWLGPMAGADMEEWGVCWSPMFGIYEQHQNTFWWEQKELEKIGKKAIERWLLPKPKRKYLVSGYERYKKELKGIAFELSKARSEEQIVALAKRWRKIYQEFWGLTIVYEIANYTSPVYLEKAISSKVTAERMHEALEVLLAPIKPSFHQQEELELLNIATKPKRQKAELLEKHAKRWFWVESSYSVTSNISAAGFGKRIKGVSVAQAKRKIDKAKRSFVLARRRKKKIAHEFALSRAQVELAELLTFFIWLQDDRKAHVWWYNSVIDRFNRFLGKRFGHNHNWFKEYTANEWLWAFTKNKEVSVAEMKRRQECIVVFLQYKGSRMWSGSSARKFIREYQKEREGNKKELTGIPVSRGNGVVRGRVRILHTSKDAFKVRPGEVLVAAMTSPDYVPAMRRSAAVVTDVGGLMSHAAVVSRELGIPCVTSTKLATKVLKTGDLIEVDAGRGIVKKL